MAADSAAAPGRWTLRHPQAVALMVLVTLMWSSAGVVSRHLEHARSFEVTFWRAFFTFVSLCVLLPLVRGPQVFARMRHAPRALWVSALCWCVMFTAFMVALVLTSVGNVLVTMALGPLLTAVVAWLAIGHRVQPRTWAAIVTAGGGIAYMYAAQLDQSKITGTLVALCVPLAGAVNWTVTQHAHAQGQDVELEPAVWLGAALSALLTLPWAWPFSATAHDVLLLGGLGVFQLAVPCVLSVWCARVLKAPELALLALLEVIFGIVLAWWGAGETPAQAVLVGGGVVIGALVVNEWMGWRQA